MTRARAHVLISGLVQGVCFRAYAMDKARSLGLTGWISNTHDGRVEAVFEGEKDTLDEVIKWCRKGPPSARVEDVKITWEEYSGDFDDFSL